MGFYNWLFGIKKEHKQTTSEELNAIQEKINKIKKLQIQLEKERLENEKNEKK